MEFRCVHYIMLKITILLPLKLFIFIIVVIFVYVFLSSVFFLKFFQDNA